MHRVLVRQNGKRIADKWIWNTAEAVREFWSWRLNFDELGLFSVRGDEIVVELWNYSLFGRKEMKYRDSYFVA